ncbi:MAG: 1-acyl-sn-glycerol-3-phosphate acyltransferase [Lachnospiraceae bacterium]|nr:1-acyl-sn-glycerol-3-phosphate acyltransferase [Lachnospiraceae bacterium]
MLRFYYVIIISIPFIIYYITKMRFMYRHRNHYTEDQCYRVVRRVCRQVMINARIRTKIFGLENLPEEGGYIMYPNHQGRYDAIGIIYAHKKPLTVVMDATRSRLPLVNEILDLTSGVRLDKSDMRGQVQDMIRIRDEVKRGRRWILFPEGGYFHNRNNVQEFMPGAFKPAMQSKCPVVPVVLIDSYKPFELNSIRKVTTQVHFLEPIQPETYASMNSRELADLVRSRIINKMKEVLGLEDLDSQTREMTIKDLRAEDYEKWKRREEIPAEKEENFRLGNPFQLPKD